MEESSSRGKEWDMGVLNKGFGVKLSTGNGRTHVLLEEQKHVVGAHGKISYDSALTLAS